MKKRKLLKDLEDRLIFLENRVNELSAYLSKDCPVQPTYEEVIDLWLNGKKTV